MAVVNRLDLALLPSEAASTRADCFVVVDVLRATTTVAALFAAGLSQLLVVDDIDLARRSATDGRLLFGEVRGLRPPGFDYGNSPVEASTAPVAGREGVLFTTNGTTALRRLAGLGALFAGALVNAASIAVAVAPFEHVTVVCAGSLGGVSFALDDFAAASAIVASIAAQAPAARLGDAARLGQDLAAKPGWASETIRSSHHADVLHKLGLDADVDYACRSSVLDVAPRAVPFSGSQLLMRA